MTTKKEWGYFVAGAAVGIGLANLYIYYMRQQYYPFSGIERVPPNAANVFRAALFG